MSGVETAVTGPYCAALGCRNVADVVIRHDNGARPACAACADGQEVMRDVE